MTVSLLCAIDKSAHSARAATLAFGLTKQLNAKLTLLVVNPILSGRGAPTYVWTDEEVEGILEQMGRRAQWLGVANVRRESRRANGVADSIIAYADQNEVDLIVIGASDRSRLAKWLSGSVSREVAEKANCPIMLVRRIRGQQP
jgi:nucleotide-binding universal stress UspA family protein